eukprot:COSAG05_NODE_4889_length_1335_cov_1.630259_1_plen_113_part_00
MAPKHFVVKRVGYDLACRGSPRAAPDQAEGSGEWHGGGPCAADVCYSCEGDLFLQSDLLAVALSSHSNTTTATIRNRPTKTPEHSEGKSVAVVVVVVVVVVVIVVVAVFDYG